MPSTFYHHFAFYFALYRQFAIAIPPAKSICSLRCTLNHLYIYTMAYLDNSVVLMRYFSHFLSQNAKASACGYGEVVKLCGGSENVFIK